MYGSGTISDKSRTKTHSHSCPARFASLASLFRKGSDGFLPGWVGELDGKAVGIVNMQRRGNTEQWIITNVGLLPEFRRRGYARILVQAAIQHMRDLGAQVVILDVIATNLPARRLYEQLGF